MKVLAIDPGYDRVGIAIVSINNNKELVEYSECFTTDKKLSLDERIFSVADHISSIIDLYSPKYLGIETLFLFKNQKTVMGVSEARGVIKYIAKINNLEIIELTPLQIKIAITGYGHATKDQVFSMIKHIVDIDLTGKIDDEVDAIAIGITGLAHIKSNKTYPQN